MTKFYEWDPHYKDPVLAIFLATIGFAVYWFISIDESVKGKFFQRFQTEKAWVYYIVFQKIAGFILMGVIPGFILLSNSDYTLTSLGLNLNGLSDSLFHLAWMGPAIIAMNYFATKNPLHQSTYPQTRIVTWGTRQIATNSIAWSLYLLGYEFLFRGILLIVCYDSFGFWPALAINVGLYSTTHIPKGAKETIGTLPYGILLCYITISTGSIFVAFITHVIMALTSDFFSVHHNPNMSFSGGKP